MAWTWSLNWGIITPELTVGTCPRVPDDLERIMEKTGATAVLSLQHDECLARYGIDYAEMERGGAELGLVMSRCPIRDFDPSDTQKRLPEAVRALAVLQTGGHRTYVHCTAGISRAPLTVFGYLTLVAEVSEDRARQLIVAGRPGSIPYWEAYDAARTDLLAELREPIERRASELQESGTSSSRSEARNRAEVEILRATLSMGRAGRGG
jgi:hypothetical protein